MKNHFMMMPIFLLAHIKNHEHTCQALILRMGGNSMKIGI